jgi:hypothetical protein
MAVRTGRTTARSGAAGPTGSRGSSAAGPGCSTGPRRPPVRGREWLAGDDSGGVGATTVGVLNRRDTSSRRGSGCCKPQKADCSGDLRPHDAELSSSAYRR